MREGFAWWGRLATAFVCSVSILGVGSVVVAAPEGVEQRIEDLERELEALKQDVSQKEKTGSPAAAQQPAKKQSPLQWNVTDNITFIPGLRVQTDYTYDEETNDNDIFLRRVRLKGSGTFYTFATFGSEIKIDSVGKAGSDPKAVVENAWIQFDSIPHARVRAGLYDLPFSRIALTSDSKLLFIDRGLIKDALTDFGLADNTIGLLLHGRPFEGRVGYSIGIFDNDKFERVGSLGRRSAKSLMPAGRLTFSFLDPEPPGGYADYRSSYIGQEGQRFDVGANGAYLRNAQDGSEKFDLIAWGVDAFFSSGPYTLQAEYDWFQQDSRGPQPSITNYGWFVQGGYLLEWLHERVVQTVPWLPQLELAARYQDLDADSVINERLHWTSLGMNFYIRQHNLKIQTDYTFKNNEGNLYQLQLQLDF